VLRVKLALTDDVGELLLVIEALRDNDGASDVENVPVAVMLLDRVDEALIERVTVVVDVSDAGTLGEAVVERDSIKDADAEREEDGTVTLTV